MNRTPIASRRFLAEQHEREIVAAFEEANRLCGEAWGVAGSICLHRQPGTPGRPFLARYVTVPFAGEEGVDKRATGATLSLALDALRLLAQSEALAKKGAGS